MLVIQPIENLIFYNKKTTIIFKLLSFIFMVVFLLSPFGNVYAQIGEDEITEVAAMTGMPQDNLFIIIGRALQVLFGLIGLVLFGYVLYAGYQYMTSGGEPAKLEAAKKRLLYAIIGIVIILLAFSITTFIIAKLNETLYGTGGGGGSSGGVQVPYYQTGYNSNALGLVVQDHFPGVDMTVAANTKIIMVKFREPIDPSSILLNKNCVTPKGVACEPNLNEVIQHTAICSCSGQLNPAAIKIYQACDSIYAGNVNAPEDYNEKNRTVREICNTWTGNYPSDDKLIKAGKLTLQSDMRTFVFLADQNFGNTDYDIRLIVFLTSEIKKFGVKQSVFSGLKQNGYSWAFTTNTTIDETPPYIIGVTPIDVFIDANGFITGYDYNGNINKKKPRNQGVRVDFSEPIIPLAFSVNSKETAANQEITVKETDNLPRGNFTISNAFRSVVFTSTTACSVDGTTLYTSCGREAMCLPANAKIDITVNSVSEDYLINPGKPPAKTYPVGGILDTALNALDTDGKIGPGNQKINFKEDSFKWSFYTSAEVDLSPPKIISVSPVNGADKSSGVTPDVKVSATFDEALNPSTVNNSTVTIKATNWDGWYYVVMDCPSTEADPTSCDKTLVIKHAAFPMVEKDKALPMINPSISSGIEDMLQNCFNPCVGPECPNLTNRGDSCSP